MPLAFKHQLTKNLQIMETPSIDKTRESFLRDMAEVGKPGNSQECTLEQPWIDWWYGVVSSRVESVIWPVMLAGNQGRHHSAKATGIDLGVPKARGDSGCNK